MWWEKTYVETEHSCRYNEAEADAKVKEILMKGSEGAGVQQEKVSSQQGGSRLEAKRGKTIVGKDWEVLSGE